MSDAWKGKYAKARIADIKKKHSVLSEDEVCRIVLLEIEQEEKKRLAKQLKATGMIQCEKKKKIEKPLSQTHRVRCVFVYVYACSCCVFSCVK